MKTLNSRNKKIKWFHDITGFPFSKCRQKLREKGDFDKVCEEYFLDKMKVWKDERPNDEILMGSVSYVKLTGTKMTPDLRILEDIADTVISELNGICVAGKWIKCTDIFLSDGLISMEIVDNCSRRLTSGIFIGNSINLLNPKDQRYVIICLIDDIMWAYDDDDDVFFERDDEWDEKWI